MRDRIWGSSLKGVKVPVINLTALHDACHQVCR